MTIPEIIRKPAVMGSFYEDNEKSLIKQIEKCFLHEVGPGKLPSTVLQKERKIIGLVSPHAGFMCSGPVAAHGFYRIALDGKPDTIIIIGPNHRGFGETVSIMINGKWKTPLGELEIDKELAKKILNNSKVIKSDYTAHQYEHSIEVQLPFIQYIFDKEIKIVPICVTNQDIETSEEIAQSIYSSIGNNNVLIIASSDFSHYEPHEYAKKIDMLAIEAILEFDYKKLYDLIYRKNLTMCGFGPITAMLMACQSSGVKNVELLKYATSGEILFDYSQVVGYASIAVNK